MSMKWIRRDAWRLWRVGFEKEKILRLDFKNDGMMDENIGDDKIDDIGEVRWSCKNDESEKGKSRRGWRSEWGGRFQRWNDA